MSRFWWLLPGPEDFIRRAVEELREGRNLALLLPRHLPNGLDVAVRAERFPHGEDGIWAKMTVASRDGPPPARQIAERFLPSVPAGAIEVSWLAHHDQLPGQVVWLDEITADVWPAWRDFLAEYAHACRSRPLIDRTVLVAVLSGPCVLEPPDEDVALAVRRWIGVIEPIDQFLYVSQLLRSRPGSRLQTSVTASVIAALAMWDPGVAEHLIRLPMKEVLRPHASLTYLAQQRHWVALPQESAARWLEGMADQFTDCEQIHSSILAALGDSRSIGELHRRIWSAQVGVLLPYVEGRRRELLERLDGQLVGPFRCDNGVVIQDPRDLEIGQIEYPTSTRQPDTGLCPGTRVVG